jgi:hypothetical protein
MRCGESSVVFAHALSTLIFELLRHVVTSLFAQVIGLPRADLPIRPLVRQFWRSLGFDGRRLPRKIKDAYKRFWSVWRVVFADAQGGPQA